MGMHLNTSAWHNLEGWVYGAMWGGQVTACHLRKVADFCPAVNQCCSKNMACPSSHLVAAMVTPSDHPHTHPALAYACPCTFPTGT